MCAASTSRASTSAESDLTEYSRRNDFFNPNVCHICKAVNLKNILCSECKMISYCCKYHNRLHREEHMDMCQSLNRILRIHYELFNFTCRFNQEEWIASRKLLMNLVKADLSRNLEPYEQQMIFFAKSCLICHQQKYLGTCWKCRSSHFCAQHATDFYKQHSLNCDELLLYFNLATKPPPNFTFKNKFVRFPDKDRPVDNMNSFILQYMRTEKDVNIWDAEDYYCSDCASGPLTLYYKMKISNLLHIFGEKGSTCVIHIIAANSVDKEYVPAWELLLHLLHETRQLKLILIGSELNNESNSIEICFKCDNMQERFIFESYCTSYHTYVNSDNYTRPNVIVGFEIDFSNEELWFASLIELRNQNCPLLITAASKLKSDQNIDNIEKVLGNLRMLNLISDGENEFSSTLPCRDLENDSIIIYRNKYVAVFSNLVSLKWSPSSTQI